MSNLNQLRRRGFTLIELTVAASVIGVLVALLLPAVQQAREAARRSTCKNNLKQIAIALHNYHDVYSSFPPGWTGHYPHAASPRRFGWQAAILPFVDQAPLYNLLNFNVMEMPDATQRELVMEVPPYRCPTDRTQATNPMRGNFGTSNYSGNLGNEPLPRWTPGGLNLNWPGGIDTPVKTNGIMFWNSRVRIRDITDGTSNTFLAGERSLKSGAGIWPGVRSNRAENDTVTDCSPGNEVNSGLAAFTSQHQGGAHFMLCDGAVVFVSENIDSQAGTGQDMGTYQKLGARNDNQPIGRF